MKEKIKTATEVSIDLVNEIRKQELRFWLKQYPKAKVKFDKKHNQIVILYPLPKDFKIIDRIIELKKELKL
jgi:hypothetical protein